MKEIQDIIDGLGVDRPIFGVTIDTSGDLTLNTLKQYSYQYPDESTAVDPLEKIVYSEYDQIFDKRNNKFEKTVTVRKIIDTICRKLRAAYISASPNKKPKNTDTYDWLCRADSRPILYPYIVALYRYVYINTGPDYRFDGKNIEHARNFIEILKRIKEKHE